MNIQSLLSDKVSQALIAAGASADSEAQVRQSAKAQFGDYQANGVMSVAKNSVCHRDNWQRKWLNC
ncbi:arginyl-tRNA synthetase [Rahnella aquatilis CIP 78.65 = ATCC 33071]|nr:arginyl-tRNA synthetase [Rahnella aquatilis CIP 78.65 = ATCC 33071]